MYFMCVRTFHGIFVYGCIYAAVNESTHSMSEWVSEWVSVLRMLIFKPKIYAALPKSIVIQSAVQLPGSRSFSYAIFDVGIGLFAFWSLGKVLYRVQLLLEQYINLHENPVATAIAAVVVVDIVAVFSHGFHVWWGLTKHSRRRINNNEILPDGTSCLHNRNIKNILLICCWICYVDVKFASYMFLMWCNFFAKIFPFSPVSTMMMRIGSILWIDLDFLGAPCKNSSFWLTVCTLSHRFSHLISCTWDCVLNRSRQKQIVGQSSIRFVHH